MKASKLIDELSEVQYKHPLPPSLRRSDADRTRPSDRDAMQAAAGSSQQHREAPPEEAEGWASKEEFIDYLENTLIPDLKDSGSHATAEDFETAVGFLRDAGSEHPPEGEELLDEPRTVTHGPFTVKTRIPPASHYGRTPLKASKTIP